MSRMFINGVSILFLISFAVMAQSQPEKFVIGAYAQSVPEQSYITNPPLLENAKINHLLFIGTKVGADPQGLYLENGDTALLPYSGTGAWNSSNLNRLAEFNGVLLGNSSANTQIVRPFLTSTNTTVSNFDWIYYLSSAYHNKFDATVKKYERTDSTIELYHGCGDTDTVDGEVYWSSSGPTYYYDPSLVVLGPSYALETRYRGAYDAAGNPDTVQYEVRYDMRLRYPYQAGQPDSLVARIYVYATYADHNYNPAQIKDTILSSRDLRRSDFNVSTAKLLQFGLAGFRESLGRPDTTIKYVLQTVEFRVKKLSDSLEFLIKEIECYDTRIWKKYFSNLNYYGSEWRTSHIATYLSTFTGNSVFADKFKYVMTIDEPHTIASYDAIRIISEDLDSMRNSNPKTPRLHTHFYPGWNGLRERNKFYTLKNWLLNANPEPLVFYYIHQMSDSPPVAIDVVRNLVHQASKFNDNKPYYFVINTWNEPSSGWRHPRKWELRADVMLALATGCKGIFYEPFYSYSTVEGLTDKKSIPLVFNEIGIFVRDSINARLDTTLGYTLLDYKYTGKYAQTYHQPDTSIVFEGSFIDSDSTENIKILNAEEGITKVFVGLFEHKMNQYDQGIFIVNYDSVSRQVFPRIDKPQAFQHYTNIRVRDCEGGYDTVFSHRLLMRDKLSGGNGKFYLLRPVIRNGGDLVYSDTVKTADTLRENRLRVKAGAILTINASYTASQDIIVESGGKLVINPGKTLTFTDGAKLRVYGSFVSRGMSNSPIGINFTAVDIAKQNGIYLDSLSIDSLEYTNIANCYFGIHSRYTDPYISECNISNTKVGIYLDNAEYQPDMEEGAKILNTSVSSGLTGLDIYESSAKIMSCNIESSGTGISIYSNSFPVFSRSMDYGLNRITGQDLGMDISYSTPLLGYKEIEYYGYNSITKAEEGEYDLMANEAGTIYSQECWWGESTPNTDHFSLQNSYLEYEPALTYDPFGDTYQNIGNNNSAKSARIEPEGGDNPTLSLKDKYKAALRKYLSGELSEARQMCRNIILSFPDSATTFSSFYLLLQIEGKAGNRSDSLNGFLGSINPGNLKKKLYLLAKIKLAENSQPGSYPQVITGLQNWYPDTVMAPYLLFKKLKYYLDISKNKDSVEVIKNQLTVSYPHHKLTREAKILIGMDELQKRGGNSVSVIPVKPVLENYPNPFNPSTTIRYGINIPGEVKIGIYNILGELVQVLVNEEKEKGIYTTTLNANRFSSGVYICRMISADGVLVRKIMLLR